MMIAGVKKNIIFAHLAVIGANIIYGINYVVAKGIMPDYFPPRVAIVFRIVGATAIFWLAARFFPRPTIPKADYLRLALCGFFGIALNQIMFFEGLNLTTPINASIIMVGVPVLVLVFAQILLHERITRNKIIGIGLGMTGAVYLILHDGSFASGTFLGNLFIFINASSYAFFLVLVKPLMLKYSPITIMKWIFTFGLIYVLPVSVGLLGEPDYANIPFTIWLSVAYIVVFTTVIAYFLNNYSLKNISPTVNSAYIYLQPFLATMVALVAGKDRLTRYEIIAALFIFTGVYFVSFRGMKLS